MASVVKIKRSAIAGKRPTTSNIETGELALNLSDGRLFSSNGTSVFEVGANVHSLHVGTGNVSFGNGAFTFPTTDGTNGQVLSTNGSGNVTWQSISSGGLTIEQANSSAATESYTNITTLQFDEDSGFDVTNPSSGVAKVAMNSTFKYWQVNGNTQLTAVGLDTVNFIAGDGVTISANGSASPQELTISASGGVTVSDNAPSSPSEGDLWFDSTNLKTYVYYSSTWVQTNPTAAGVSNAYLTSTYTSNAVFQAFVANTNAAIAAAGGEVSNAYLTSTFTTNTAFQSALANTNAWISTLEAGSGGVSNATFQAALANTNAYIATKTDDTVALATNTALRTLISDRVQVANLNSTLSDYWPSANVISHVSSELSALVDSAPSTLDTLNELAAALGDDANFSTTVTNSLASKATWAALTATNTAIRTLVSDTLQVANAAATYLPLAGGTISGDIIPSTNGTINLGSSTKAFAELYLSGNTIRLGNVDIKDSGGTISFYDAGTTDLASTQFDNLINDRLQVANAAVTYQTIAVERAALANTNSYIATKLNTATFNSALANTNAYIASVAAAAGDAGNSYLTSTYTSNAVFQAFVANTNAYIAASAGSGGLSNSEVSDIVDSKLNVLDVGDVVGTDGNSGQILISYGDGTAYWSNNNPSVDLSGYVTNTAFQSALANTNAYIASVEASAGQVSNSYLTSTYTTNTTFQSALANTNVAVADRMQVANVVSYTAKYLEVANVTTTDTSSLATWAALIATNTSIRSAISTEVSNLVDSAPSTLDTLNELAAALGDDANFATTVTTSLAGKASNSFVTSTYTTNTDFQAFVANTNAYIASAAGSGGLSNTEVENIVDGRINVLDLGDIVGTDGNSGQILISYGDGTAYWSNNNPSVDTSALATWSALTATNTAIRTLVDDRVQVANLNSTIADYWPSANVISHVSTELASLVDSAPAALDTLNELAAALGDDANFSTTVTNSLAAKATWSALTSTNTAIRTLVDDRLQVANAAATYTTISTFNSALANTNAYIASVEASAGQVSNAYLTSTYTTNTAFQSFVANTNAYIATVAAAPSGLSNTEVENIVDARINVLDLGDVVGTDGNAGQILISYGDGTAYWSNNNPSVDLSGYVTNTAFQSALANTNAYVATKTDDTVVLATNTALRTLIDDRMQVANVVSYTSKYLEVANVTSTDTSSLATWAALIATNTSIRSAISTEVANLVDSAPATLDTLNELAAALGDDANFASTITTSLAGKASNAAFQSALANTNAYIASVSAAAGDVSNTDFQAALANTNAYIASVAASAGLSEDDVNNLIDGRVNVLDLGDIVGTDGNAGQILLSSGDGTAYWSNNNPSVDLSGYVGNTYLTSTFTTNTAFQSALANTNLAVNDRMQVANVTSAISTAIANLVDTAPSTLDTLNELAAALGDDANFASTVTTSLAGKASNAAFQSALANTNAYIATKTDDTVALATNTALRTLISDRMQVANVISYTAKYLEVANSASLGEVSNSYLTSTYTSNAVFQAFVANTNAAIAAAGGLGNSEVSDIVDSKLQVLDLGDVVGTDGNAGQILISYGDGTAYWSNNNPSVDLSGYVGNTYLQSTFVSNTAFQSFVANTNAAIANAGEVSNSYLTSTYTSNATFQSFVANTNAYIATKTGDATVLATNTALRTLISDRVQVANLNSTLSDYWPSANVISYVSGEITSLIDSAPGALDTLNELAAALGDDANFSATVTTSLASKAANSYVNSTFVSNTAFQSFVANTNAYIAASAGSGGLSNSEVSDIVDSKLQVLDIGDVVGADGGVNQVLLSNGDGTGQWGSAPSSMQEFAFTASNNQTTFTGADDYSSTLSYTAGKLLVFLNGVKLARFDFQANNGTSVVFNDGVAANDHVEFVAF